MKNLRPWIVSAILVPIFLFAQTNPIPNPGFETWSSGTPTGWMTNNVASVYTVVTQSTDARTGSSSAQGAVVDWNSNKVPPFLFSSFPINQRYGSLTGYYKFTGVNNDSLIIAVLVFKNQVGYGGGSFETGVNTSTYTQFSITIDYATADIPDSALIEVVIGNSTVENVGSVFKVDDFAFGAPTSAEKGKPSIPDRLILEQNYPNPFNPTTLIKYLLPQTSHVRIGIFNILGQEVFRLVDEERAARVHEVTFDARNLPSGIYLYRLEAAGVVQTKRMVLLR